LIKQLNIIKQVITKDDNIRGKFNPVTLTDILVNSNLNDEALHMLSFHIDDVNALKKLCILNKSSKNFEEALSLFIKLSKNTNGLRDYIYACTEIAKIFEHRFKSFKKALFFTIEAMRKIERNSYLYPDKKVEHEKDLLQLKKRYFRLKRRLSSDESSVYKSVWP